MATSAALPIYRRLAEQLIREIAAGRLLDGERLPPERNMSVAMGVSVGTLRKALADLEERGLLERRQGSGNYVRNTGKNAGIYAFFRLELADGGGGLPTAEVLSVERTQKPKNAPWFGPSELGYRIRRARSVGGVPAALEEIWIDGAWVDSVQLCDLSESLYLYYRDQLGLVIARVEDRVGLSEFPDWHLARGVFPAGGRSGFVERDGFDRAGDQVEYSRTWFDADRIRYVARLK